MEKTKQKQSFVTSITDPYVLLFALICIMAILTYILPAGTYDRYKDEVTGRTLIDPQSFHYIENTPVGIEDIFHAPALGLGRQQEVIFFVLIIGGAFEVLTRTGFANSLIGVVIKKLKGKDKALFFIIIAMMATLGATIGFTNACIVFIPIVILMCKSLGYDELVAVTLIYVGNLAGKICGMMNPFGIPIAQEIAELPIYSGVEYRTPWFIITIIATYLVTVRYANKIKQDPTKSLMYGVNKDEDSSEEIDFSSFVFTNNHKILATILVGALFFTMWGTVTYNWGLSELAAVFLAYGIITGLAARVPIIDVVEGFLGGAAKMLKGIMVVGFATGILVIMEQGQILDTIVNFFAVPIMELSPVLSANAMYMFQWFLNLLIPSGVGQAAVSMPLLVPMADLAEVTRQTVVTAFHFGDGVTNLIAPGMGPLMASLGIAKIPYTKWVKYIIPMLIVWTIIGFLGVTGAQLINLGPF